MIVRIERFIQTTFATVGQLTVDGFRCWTLERPWRNNEPFFSCVPEGTYEVAPDEEGKYTGHPELQNVSGRTEIVIHPANEVSDLQGCIAPGLGYEVEIPSARLTATSRNAYDQLVETVGTTFTLVITSRRSRL